jgi:hypothetical protein
MSKFWIRLIAILEIVGGIFGIAFVVLQVVAEQTGRLFASIALAVYILSFVAGIALLRNRPFGRIASIIVQCIQLPKYASQLFVFMFSFGFDAYLYFALTNTNAITGFAFKFLAFNQLFVNVADAPVIFGVSIPATVFLAMLLRHKLQADSADDANAHTDQIVEPERNQVISHSRDLNA